MHKHIDICWATGWVAEQLNDGGHPLRQQIVIVVWRSQQISYHLALSLHLYLAPALQLVLGFISQNLSNLFGYVDSAAASERVHATAGIHRIAPDVI